MTNEIKLALEELEASRKELRTREQLLIERLGIKRVRMQFSNTPYYSLETPQGTLVATSTSILRALYTLETTQDEIF